MVVEACNLSLFHIDELFGGSLVATVGHGVISGEHRPGLTDNERSRALGGEAAAMLL